MFRFTDGCVELGLELELGTMSLVCTVPGLPQIKEKTHVG